MSARVGIVVRTVDRPDFLRRTFKDISSQNFDDWRVVVVVDGGEVDAVAAVVAEASWGDRVRVIATTAPGGRCAAANAGVAALDTEYVVLHDDDDFWHPDFLRRTVARLDESPAESGVGVTTAIVYETFRDGAWIETERVPFWEGLDSLRLIDLVEVNRAVPISVLYRRSLHDEVGPYDETLDAVEDWEFYLRALARHRFGFIAGEPLAFWTQRPDAHGAEGNSMFALDHLHRRDDQEVRERALRAWIADNGMGLPLYIAQVEQRIRAEVRREIELAFERQRADIRQDIDSHQPVWSRLRRLRRRLLPRRR
ncbi:glycosyltransferase [Microbacterium sp. W1N]|uniref:glycosyltransferase family 2 protein n=1 Tax=Microbacterium festucae TaxID=2977531 RepID=UPI0021BF5812|nr:glycosyltransferase [Microbacterium festucae]MCT9818776.1 glycosyltransferase [Microbacterium festucae]